MGFDKEAKDWDKDLKKVERANIFAREIIAALPPNKNSKALEFGSGTGLLSDALKDNFQTITLVDTSAGMIEVLKEKIEKDGIKNFNPIQIDLLEDTLAPNSFDVIYTLMSLHHVVALESIIEEFHKLLPVNGFLCIADLVQEDGSFHADSTSFDGHNGFDKEELISVLHKKRFETVSYKICYEVEKEVEGEIRKYPLFLLVAKKIIRIKL